MVYLFTWSENRFRFFEIGPDFSGSSINSFIPGEFFQHLAWLFSDSSDFFRVWCIFMNQVRICQHLVRFLCQSIRFLSQSVSFSESVDKILGKARSFLFYVRFFIFFCPDLPKCDLNPAWYFLPPARYLRVDPELLEMSKIFYIASENFWNLFGDFSDIIWSLVWFLWIEKEIFCIRSDFCGWSQDSLGPARFFCFG